VRPVLRICDDTHTTQRATTLHSQPLGALAGQSLGVLSLSRHLASAVLGRVRSASAVQAAVAVVAALRLALARRLRLASPVAPSVRVVGFGWVRAPRRWRWGTALKKRSHPNRNPSLASNVPEHRPTPETGAGSESSVQRTRSIETEARGGGSCASDC
jgi:hypothetical protein